MSDYTDSEDFFPEDVIDPTAPEQNPQANPQLVALLAALRRRHSRFEQLAPLANTPTPQGQMVSGIYVRPNPLQQLIAGVQQGLGMKGAMDAGQRQGEDAQARYLYEQEQKAKSMQQVGDIARERMTTQQDIAGQRAASQEEIAGERVSAQRDAAEQRNALLEAIQKLREERLNQTEAQRQEHYDTQERLRLRDQQLREAEQAARGRGQDRLERRARESLRLRGQSEERQRAKLMPNERRRLPGKAPNVDDLLNKYGGQ